MKVPKYVTQKLMRVMKYIGDALAGIEDKFYKYCEVWAFTSAVYHISSYAEEWENTELFSQGQSFSWKNQILLAFQMQESKRDICTGNYINFIDLTAR